SLESLRLTFLRKGYFSRQERLLRELRTAGCSTAAICALQIGDVTVQDDMMVIRPPAEAPVEIRSGAVLQRYLQRRAELGLDCNPVASLFAALEDKPFSAERLQQHYETIRTLRVALEANGAFCRAVLSAQHLDTASTQLSSDQVSNHLHEPPSPSNLFVYRES